MLEKIPRFSGKKQRLNSIAAGMLLSLLTAASPVLAQDTAVVPANDNTKVAWVNGGAFTGTVTATASGWTNLANVTDNNTANYGLVAYSGNGTQTTPTVSVSNGQTYNTTAFTGYRIGIVATRTKNTLATWNFLGTNQIRVSTYKSGALVEQADLDWGTSASNTVDADVGFYAHKPFDEVRVTLVSSVAGINPAGEQRLKNIYLQRYTRGAGGTSGDQATCNAQVPVTGRALTAQGVSVGIGVPPYIVPALPNMIEAMEDTDPSTHAVFPMITTLFAAGTRYEGSVKDEAVVYPAGTFAGFKLTVGTGFGTNAADVRVLTLLRNGVEVASSSTVGLAGAAILSSDGSTTIGMIAPVEFDEIKYSITTLLSPTPGINAVEVYYPVVQRFCDTPITCVVPPTPIWLKKGIQGGPTNYPVWVKPTFPVSIGTLNGSIKDIDNVIDNDPNNYAEISQLVAAVTDYGISVTSQQTGNYPAGTFAGFEIQDVNLGSGSVAIRHIVKFYKDGVATADSYDDGGSLASAKFLANSGRYLVGMRTTQDFDEIRISIQSAGSVGVYTTRVYNAIIEPFCKATVAAACNKQTRLDRNIFPVYIDGENTGTDGNSIGTLNNYFENLNNIIDTDPTNYATLHTAVSATSNVSVGIQDGSKGIPGANYELYPAGTFAGFDVSFPTIIGGGFLNNVEVSLLGPDGTVLSTQNLSGSLVSIQSSLASGGINRQIIGFVADQPFSGVKFSASKAASVNWGEIRVYSAVIQKFCPSPAIACDHLDTLASPEHPVYINGKNTGVFAVFDGNSLIQNSQDAIDASTSSYASLQLGVTAGSQLGFSVANGYDSYPAETYVGFDVSTQSWFEANGLYQTKIELYNNGVLVQTSTGDQLGAGISSDLVTGGWKRMVIGTVGRVEFDEARLLVQRVAGASIGEIRIHNFVVRGFNPATAAACAVEIECNKTYPLTDGTTTGAIPAVIEFEHTGYSGGAAAGYGIDNVWNVVSASTTDYATIHSAANGLSTGSISVAAPGKVFPAGTYAGFTVKKEPFIIAGGLFVGVTVTTYLNGVQQETKSDASLADFSLLTQWFGTPTDFYNPGFKTTKPFDEVQISIGGAASAVDQTLKVYGAYVDTRESAPQPGDGSTPLVCGPDLTPFLAVSPSEIAGTKPFAARIRVLNLITSGGPTTGEVITVRILKSNFWTFTWDGAATTNSLGALNNSIWTYSGAGAYHTWTTTAVLLKGSSRYIGFTGTFTSGAANGTLPITVQIRFPSGGERNDKNNTDVEIVSYSGL